MYIVDQEQIDNIYTQLNELEIYSFEGDSIIDPSLDVGDLLLIDGKYVIYQGSSEFTGKFKASISSKIQCKAKQETTNKTPSQKVIIRRVQSEIDQAKGTITQLTEETTEHEEKIAKVEQDINSIKQNIVHLIDYKRQINGITEIHLTEAEQLELIKLEVKGNKEYNSYLFPRANLYLRSNLHPNQRGG